MHEDDEGNPTFGLWPHLADESHVVIQQPFRNLEEDCLVAALDIKRSIAA